ncbi:flagellar protein FlaG [Desulfuribacillus alkaliarsenatis]|uniref:Flagellar protein FlaG n=1 Tax=Desulfuribacillus alkaliarsenatis TaxID=766136 RepID=A0A1E5G4N9_9FIRM|nr:flagellar protein FlaG [Desulfuribacillus alkaliarsenatis]OEF98141.1 hypothetical protein BHF68_00155 [Desulfuribacillus alkaliarsenatis]
MISSNSMHDNMYHTDKKFEYNIHKETNRLLVKIIDPTDNTTLKEIPSEAHLDLINSIRQNLGSNIDERI